MGTGDRSQSLNVSCSYHRCSKYAVVHQLRQMGLNECVLPIAGLVVRQTIDFHTQVITGQAFPPAMLVAFDEYLYSFAQELLAEAPSILFIQPE